MTFGDDQATIKQCLDCRCRGDAAYLQYLRYGDRLFISDDGERFERRQRQTRRRLRLQIAPHIFAIFGPRAYLVAVRKSAYLQAAAARLELFDQRFSRRFDVGFRLAVENRRQLFDGDGLFGNEDERFDYRFSFLNGHGLIVWSLESGA